MSSPLVLSPAESLVLLDTAGSTGREALKITLMSLMAQGVVAIEQRAKKGLFGTSKTAALRRARDLAPGAPAHESIVADMVRWTELEGGEMKTLAGHARKAFGDKLERYKSAQVLPALLRRGLVREDSARSLLFFTRKTWPLTPAGDMQKIHLQGLLQQARRLPELLHSDPAAATAIVLAAGGSLLLASELAPYYGQFAALRRSHAAGDPNSGGTYGDSGGTHHQRQHDGTPGDGAAAAGPQMDALGDGDFDFSGLDGDALASFEDGMSSLDASFDSSFGDSSSSDSGGSDSGGGDSGGGGD